ncbi:MAG: transcription-repair coupling factor [Deltaproteobacteria bacterium]|nr:transcription-repair coupling factor [Deltaproteobacteria bacterium]
MHSIDQNLLTIERWLEQGLKELSVTGISGAARVYFLSRLLTKLTGPSLVVLPNAKEAHRFFEELKFFLPDILALADPEERRLYDFPIYDISPLAGLAPHRDVVTRRLQALFALTSKKNPIIITSVESLILKILPKEALIDALEYLEVGEEVEREVLLQRLQINGYLRTSLVEETGDYSVRGGVIDIFPPLYSQPIRLEFWGDRIESIRHFDSVGQRSTEHLKHMILLPANEIIMDHHNIQRARSMGRLPNRFQDGLFFPGQEAWLNHFYSSLDTLFDFFPKVGLLILMDPHRIKGENTRFQAKFFKDVERFRQDAEERESPFPEIAGLILPQADLELILESYQHIAFSELPIEKQSSSAEQLHIKGTYPADEGLEVNVSGRGKVSMAPLAEKISKALNQGFKVILVCRTEQQAGRLKEILHNYGVEVDEQVDHWDMLSRGKGLSICLGRLSKGFAWPDLGIQVISEDEIFGSKRSRSKAPLRAESEAVSVTGFSQIHVGDLVVHQDHGIGQYGGLCKMEIARKVNDFILINYAQNDRLYIPADRISVLQKYVGADEKNPKLDRLGGQSWDLAKKKAKKSIQSIARQLVETYALRMHQKGYAFSRPDNYFREFEATFEHEETSDQTKAIDDVLSDLESEKPMDRLICGDVGFGKTEVAIRAAFKVFSEGKQVALLVPTTVLAEQHYETFRKRMSPYQVEVQVVSRFKSRAEQKEILARVRSGKTDILIGTHRILQKDVSFRDLGLLIVDEEQRFGVKQKETLKKYRALVDVLALTATPIPRTLHMSLMGIRDLSIIETPPEDRLAIQTYISPYDEATITRAIEFELDRGGQAFFVHNRVQDIEEITHRLAELVPQAKFSIAHGQMREKDLEMTMIRFLRREIDVLVCTTIIESGLDIPSTNTIIINDTDRFGLSQIYQLRGRVGRSNETAYAYLLFSDGSQLTRQAEKRLKALMDFSHLGAGIHLALHDLKIRGGGNILGFTQAGHISAIGYELYMQMIEQAVAELKGEEWQEEINPEINVDIPAFIPEDFILDIDVRLNMYRRLSSLCEDMELKAITEEIEDRFGPPPPEVSNLLSVMSVRLLLKRMHIIRLDVTQDTLVLLFSTTFGLEPNKIVKWIQRNPKKSRFLSEQKIIIRIEKETALDALQEVKKILHEILLTT